MQQLFTIGPVYTPRGHPRFLSWDSPYRLVIPIRTNEARFGDLLLMELVAVEDGNLTLWWMEPHSLSMKRLTATICLTIAVLLGSEGVGKAFQRPHT